MPVSSMKDLLEAGVHFGHHTRKWNPKMKRYIYGARNDIYIIDLHKTRKKLEEAYSQVRQMAFQGRKFLFVGTKKQAQDPIREAAQSCGQYYVNHRWLGGMLTNWDTVQTRIDRLNQIDRMIEDGTMAKLVKKEQARVMEERTKLDNVLGGIRTMSGLPDVIFIIDCKKEHIAIKEAQKLGIPIVAVVDTNCDPDEVEFPIPSNDDAIRAVSLMASQMAEAINEGRTMAESVREERASQMSGAAAAHFDSGQIDYAGAEQVQFAPVSSDDDEAVFEQEMAKPFIPNKGGNPLPTDGSLPGEGILPENIDQTTRASGGMRATIADVSTAEDLLANTPVTTTDQSMTPTGGPVVPDAPVAARADTFETRGNEGGTADQDVTEAVAEATS